MVIKVYLTNICSSTQLKKEMLHVTDILSSMSIPMETVDISDPNREEDKKFMRANAEPKAGMKYPLPPQIFSDDQYCGGYDEFYEAVETNNLYAFLKMADKIEVSQAQIEGDEEEEKKDEVEQNGAEEEQTYQGEEKQDQEEKVAEEEEKQDKLKMPETQEQTDIQTEYQD